MKIDNLTNIIRYRIGNNSKGLGKKNVGDLFWNISSNVVMAITGLLINVLIAREYGTELLGVFHQVYSYYLIASQLSISGFHLSVLESVSRFNKDKQVINNIMTSASILTFITSIVICSITFFLKGNYASLLKSPMVEAGILMIIPGLLFFSLNKLFLAFLNGVSDLKAYAIFQTIRYILIIICLLLLIYFKIGGEFSPVVFTLAEFILLIILSIYLKIKSGLFITKISKKWLKHHFVFGLKVGFGNLLFDINSRVSIIILGIFTKDSVVGIFSFVAMLAEGFILLPLALRAIINPELTRLFHQNENKELEIFISSIKSISYKLFTVFGVLMIIAFPIISFLLNQDHILKNWSLFIIMMLGYIFVSGYLPFQMFFSQIGFPGLQSIYMASFFLINLLLSLFLVPLFSMYGAALSTSIAFLGQLFIMRKITKAKIGLII